MATLLWTNRANFGPSARRESAMCYDSVRSRTVLFGGDGNNAAQRALLGDTWEWDGSFWTQMDDIGPSPRSLSCVVYDTSLQASVLFGGLGPLAQGDTWKWDGSDWTKLSESGPGARAGAGMAFDTTRKRTVLFGGDSADGLFLNDTWEFDGENWTQQEDIGPSARVGHCMAFDNVGNRVILFGGMDATNNTLNDTWAWDGSGWVQLAEFGPPPRLNACLAAAGGTLILFGGVSSQRQDAVAQFFGDTWEFDGKRWTQRQDIGAGPLQSGAMAFYGGRNRVVLFGGLVEVPGQAASTSGLTWETSSLVTAGDPGILRVASISFPPRVFANNSTPVKFTLSAAAPVDTTILVAA